MGMKLTRQHSLLVLGPLAALLALGDGCSTSDESPIQRVNQPNAPADAGSETAPDAMTPPPFPDLASLHDVAISRTCALNNGVCHDSKQYPDLRTVSDFLANTVNKPCNTQVD